MVYSAREMATQEAPIGSGFTEGELEFASFWAKNRLIVRRSVYALLLIINAGLWGFTFWGVIDAYAIRYPVESRITQDIANNQFVAQQLEANRPKSINVEPTLVFQGTDNRLDLITSVLNPNDQWIAQFSYQYNVSGEETPVQSGFLLPKQKAILGTYGFAPKTAGARVGILEVNHLTWKRVNPDMVGGNYTQWIADHDAFGTSNVQTNDLGQAGAEASMRTSFTFTNPTAYGYWSIPLTIVLLHADTPIAATSITLSQVKPGESRNVNVDWFEHLPQITDTQVIPSINFFDPTVYLPSDRLTQ
jgi:hypothetical protein